MLKTFAQDRRDRKSSASHGRAADQTLRVRAPCNRRSLPSSDARSHPPCRCGFVQRVRAWKFTRFNNRSYNIEGLGNRFVAVPTARLICCSSRAPCRDTWRPPWRRTYDRDAGARSSWSRSGLRCNGGIFGDSYATLGRVSNCGIRWNVEVAGCPPSPRSAVAGRSSRRCRAARPSRT